MTKMICNFIAVSLSVIICASIASAQDLSGVDKEALLEVTSVLKNRSVREKHKQKNEMLNKVDRDLDSLTHNDAQKDAIYNTAAKIMEQLAKEANGDAMKMLELIQKAQNNPQQFMESLDESNKAMIRGIANDIEKTKVDSKQP